MTPRALAGLVGALLVAMAAQAAAWPAPERAGGWRPGHRLRAPRIWVVDGDTFHLRGERIRLRGIDTPERGQPGSAAARWRLIQLLRSGLPVTILRRGADAYGRTLADVSVGGVNVAEILCREGFAKPPGPPFRTGRPSCRP